MDVKLYAVYDKKAAVYRHFFVAPDDTIAIRVFAEASIDRNNFIGKYPSDFDLYKIAGIDTTSGKVNQLDTFPPQFLFSAVSATLVNKEEMYHGE